MNQEDQNILTLGQLLKNEREKLGITIEKAANILMVRQRHLVNLENDLFDAFPAGVYFRGFLRSYARLLGLDEQKVFEYYKCQLEINDYNWDYSASPTQEPKPQEESSKDEIFKKPFKFKISITPEWIFRILAFFIIVFIVLYFVFALRNVSRLPVLYIEEPQNNAVVENEKIEIKGRVDKESTLKINKEQYNVMEDGDFNASIVLMEGLNEINFEVTNKFDNTLEEKLFVTYDPTQNQQNQIKRITFKVDTEPVKIKIKNSQLDIEETLPPGGEKTIEIKEETVVEVNKGNAIYFEQQVQDSKQAFLNPPVLEIFSDQEGRSQRTFAPE
ncbi:MAG: hypothetical protein GF335_02130 [Candidatus Moranbacteria bacterium]|nr:hypothetical protein [Candidatus Moranbacteria bacterium]